MDWIAVHVTKMLSSGDLEQEAVERLLQILEEMVLSYPIRRAEPARGSVGQGRVERQRRRFSAPGSSERSSVGEPRSSRVGHPGSARADGMSCQLRREATGTPKVIVLPIGRFEIC